MGFNGRRFILAWGVPAKNSIYRVIIEINGLCLLTSATMTAVFSSLLSALFLCLRTRASMQIEIVALRHQLAVLQRRAEKRARLGTADRLLWVWLSRVWAQWRSALVIVKPETVIAWQRKGFRLYWTWKSRGGKTGRPRVGREVRKLI